MADVGLLALAKEYADKLFKAAKEYADKLFAKQADYVVEYGTDGIWTWEKWASGKAVCYGRTGSMKVWFGRDWYGKCMYATIDVTLPQINDVSLFSSYDTIVPNIITVSGYGIHSNSVSMIEDNTLKWYSAHHSSDAEDINVQYAIELKGRWK